MLGGALIGLGWIGYVAALKTLTVAEVGVLFMTFPLFALLFGRALFGERVTARGLLAASLIVAAGVVVAPHDGGTATAGAILLALTAPAAYGLLLNIVTHKTAGLGGLGTAGAVALGSVIALAPLLLGLPASAIVPAGADALLWLIAFGLLTALIPQLALATFAPRIGTVPTTMAAAVELPATLAVGWLALQEPLGANDLIAASLILVAITIGATVAARR